MRRRDYRKRVEVDKRWREVEKRVERCVEEGEEGGGLDVAREVVKM